MKHKETIDFYSVLQRLSSVEDRLDIINSSLNNLFTQCGSNDREMEHNTSDISDIKVSLRDLKLVSAGLKKFLGID